MITGIILEFKRNDFCTRNTQVHVYVVFDTMKLLEWF